MIVTPFALRFADTAGLAKASRDLFPWDALQAVVTEMRERVGFRQNR